MGELRFINERVRDDNLFFSFLWCSCDGFEFLDDGSVFVFDLYFFFFFWCCCNLGLSYWLLGLRSCNLGLSSSLLGWIGKNKNKL